SLCSKVAASCFFDNFSAHRGFAAVLAERLRLFDLALKGSRGFVGPGRASRKLNRLTESQRLSARTAAKPQQADGVWLRLCGLRLCGGYRSWLITETQRSTENKGKKYSARQFLKFTVKISGFANGRHSKQYS